MAIDKEIKKRITEEWLNTFPQLTPFAQNKLYKILGCAIVGLELIKLPHSEEYRPYYVIYPLWKKDIKTCLDAPVLMIQLYNKKGLQFNIPYARHSNYFNEAVECFKKQILVPMNGDVILKSLLELINSRFNDILIKSNSAEQAKLFELKFYGALYTESQDEVQNVINQIQKESKSWNMQMFETWYGQYGLWLQGLQEKVDNRDEFFKQIEANRKDKKIEKLLRSELKA